MIPNSDGVRPRACERIGSDKLPDYDPSSTWSGSGNGARGPVCDSDPGDERELEFEIEPQDGTDGKPCQTHVSCYAAWATEVREGSAFFVVLFRPVNSLLESGALHESETSTGRPR